MNKAIYAGSFDPITYGHLDILERSCAIFDTVYVSVLENPEKEAVFTPKERIEMIQELCEGNPKVKVESFSGLLVDYAESIGVYTLVRGIRAVSDFDYEFQLSHTNRLLNQKIETVFFMSDAKYSYLSSSVVRQLADLSGDIRHFVPDPVAKKLKAVNLKEART